MNHPLVVNVKRGAYDVYVGRDVLPRGRWGNPFEIGVHGTRDEVIELYRQWLPQQSDLIAALPELKGKRLGCHCHPRACHGSVLAELANW